MVTTKDFNDMTVSELYNLNKLLVAEIRARQREDARDKAARFKIGQRVSFTDRAGNYTEGVIEKFNSKTVSVKTPGTIWRVPPSMLTEVEPSGHDVVAALDAKEVAEFENRHHDKPPVSDKPRGASDTVW